VGLFTRVARVDPQRAAELLRTREAVVLDVREPLEWKTGHIRGSIHIPLGELAGRTDRLPRDRTIIAVCRSGNRSAAAARSLQRAGYRVENLSGGMRRWERAGLELDPRNGRIL
jgi:rhodanese-related sulfurtransferase